MLRPAREDDIPALADTLRRAWLKAYGPIMPFAVIQAWARDDWNGNHAEREWPKIVVFERHGCVVGMVQSEGDQVLELFVHPQAHRQGIGRALLLHAERTIQAAGHGRARVGVVDGNAPAFAFYAALGWRDSGEREVETIAGEAVTIRYLHKALTAAPRG